MVCTEEEWQEIAAQDEDGQVGKFVIDDTAGTIRLPRIIKLQGTLNFTEVGDLIESGGAGGGGLEVGDIGISPFIDESRNLRRYLNGQIISQSQFARFTARLKKAVETYPNLATTEANWQAIKTNSKIGQCGKFVIDDTAGTIRLPCIVKLQGMLDLSNIGNIVDDGLPELTTDTTGSHTHTRGTMNITGFFGATDITGAVDGAFYTRTISQTRGDYKGASTNNNFNFGFDASRSWTGNTSSDGAHSHTIAGTSDTVQEEAIQYPYFIQVANGKLEIDTTTEIQLNNPFDLFDIKWSIGEIENLSWAKSDGNWVDGTVYTSAYDRLVEEYTNGTEQTSDSITFRKTPRKYRIADVSQDTLITSLFDNTGVANYFVLDTANQRFKLPRTKYGFVGDRGDVGAYIPESLPQHTHLERAFYDDVSASGGEIRYISNGKTDGASIGARSLAAGTLKTGSEGISTTNADNASYQNGAPVQQRATQANLYFYVGETAKSVNIIDINALANTKQDKATAVNYNNITNCITHIPQDIKVELTDGVLTLKAGSKVYVPNGAEVFDIVTISSDLTLSSFSAEVSTEFYLFQYNGYLRYFSKAQTSSGSTAPSGNDYLVWYDTTNNIIKTSSDGGSTWNSGVSFPLCKFTATSTTITSIDQIFNGFGYIGPTAFALPGVRGLIPNGRNADGTLKNIEFTVDKVVTRTITWDNAHGQELFIGKYSLNEGLQFISTGRIGEYYRQEIEPSLVRYTVWYKPSENKVYRCDLDSNGNLVWKDNYPCYIGQWFTSATSPYPITKLTIRLPFRAVDYSEYTDALSTKLNKDFSNAVFPIKGEGTIIQTKNEGSIEFYGGTSNTNGAVLALRGKNGDNPGAFTLRACDSNGNSKDLTGYPDGTLSWGGQSIAAMGMPSGKNVDLTLGTSGTTYTAPANGYVLLKKSSTASNQIVELYTGVNVRSISSASNQQICVFAPVQKGFNFSVNYSLAGETTFFRFIYAEGDNI